MPQSKHRRKGQVRKRPTRNAPPKRNPPPSAPWIPYVGVSMLVSGLLIILAGYVVTPLQELTNDWIWFGENWPLAFGFALLVGGFGFLTQWR
jgi:hypothetical protein